ncbi:MAG: peptide deformylase, partial [Alphaproteobacteria bacterium]|nr:peptide deformylase [Alphaproteobacteria bacterium]
EDVSRPASIRIRYTNRKNAAQILDAEGLLATCIQHEIDHLNGKVFVDYVSPVKRSVIRRRMAKAFPDQRKTAVQAQAASLQPRDLNDMDRRVAADVAS